MKFRTIVIKYGYAVVEAADEVEALEKTRELSDDDFDWSYFDDEQVVEEIDYE